MTRVWVALTMVLTLIVVGAALAADWPLGVLIASAAALWVGAWLFVSAIRRARRRPQSPAG